MSTNMDVKVHQSLTGYLSVKTSDLLSAKIGDSNIKKYTKITAGLVVNTALTLSGLVESVIRPLLAVLAKGGQFFVPKQYSKTLDNKIVLPLINHAKKTIEHTAKAASSLVTVFMSKEAQIKTRSSIETNMNKALESKFMKNLVNLHINGFPASKIQENGEEMEVEEEEECAEIDNKNPDKKPSFIGNAAKKVTNFFGSVLSLIENDVEAELSQFSN